MYNLQFRIILISGNTFSLHYCLLFICVVLYLCSRTDLLTNDQRIQWCNKLIILLVGYNYIHGLVLLEAKTIHIIEYFY